MTVPAFNLLQPALPARRARAAAMLVVLLLATAMVDLVLVLAWLGLAVSNTGLAETVEQLQAQEARWRAEAVRYASRAQERAALQERLRILAGLPASGVDTRALMDHLSDALPPGVTLTSANLGAGGIVVVSGTAPSYRDVEHYARALQAGGLFAYVRVATAGSAGDATMGAGEAAPADGQAAGAGTAGAAGAVSFQMEGWLEEVPGHGGGS